MYSPLFSLAPSRLRNVSSFFSFSSPVNGERKTGLEKEKKIHRCSLLRLRGLGTFLRSNSAPPRLAAPSLSPRAPSMPCIRMHFVCIYSYIHTCIHTVCIYSYIHTYIHTHIHTTCIYSYIHTYIHKHIQHVFIHTYNKHIQHVFIHTYTHTHTYIHTHVR